MRHFDTSPCACPKRYPAHLAGTVASRCLAPISVLRRQA